MQETLITIIHEGFDHRVSNLSGALGAGGVQHTFSALPACHAVQCSIGGWTSAVAVAAHLLYRRAKCTPVPRVPCCRPPTGNYFAESSSYSDSEELV